MTRPNLSGPSLDDWLAVHGPGLVALRRELHQRPELSGAEHETTKVLAAQLADAGLAPVALSTGTGLICDIGRAGPAVALRADIDALAMEDEKDVDYRSRHPGVAHACGHDVHATIVVGAARYLASRWSWPDRRVRILLQPAEEQLPGGALHVIADGGLDDVTAVYGLHCEPKLPCGTIGLRSGAITSATDAVTIDLTGPGGHTARPELTVDLVAVAARIVTELPAALASRLGTDVPLKVVFGAIHAGAAGNVIPTRAQLVATIRTPSRSSWERLPKIVPDVLAELTGDRRLDCTVAHSRGVPPVVNDDAAVGVMRRAADRALGAGAVVDAPHSWGGDDFAWYTERVPGAYVRLGTGDPTGTVDPLDLHAGHFDVDERAIAVGVRLLVAAVEEELRGAG